MRIDSIEMAVSILYFRGHRPETQNYASFISPRLIFTLTNGAHHGDMPLICGILSV